MFKTSLFRRYYDISMHDKCPVCGQTFQPEPGFYFGAMYVSYGFSVAITVIVGIVLYHGFGDPDLWVYMTTVILAVAAIWPIQYRLSRSIFLHLFGGVRYNPEIPDYK